MILQIMSVYDSKARAFITPFTVAHVDVARRAFSDCANNPAHAFGKNPADYVLYQLGSFNDENAEIVSVVPLLNLGPAGMYKKGVPNVQE